MADLDPGDSAPDLAPGWLFRLNTTLGARLNTPAWMQSAAAVTPLRGESERDVELVPDPDPPL
jgi:hypothetical protein